jgi:hypothetical protein
MIRKQEFKTLAGAQKRAAFENAHCDKRYNFTVVRFVEGERDTREFNILRFSRYTWRIERKAIVDRGDTRIGSGIKPMLESKVKPAPYPEAAKKMAREAGIELEERPDDWKRKSP